MSRSYKKNPYHGFACCKAKTLKKAKKEMTRSSRRLLEKSEDFSNGGSYKKLNHSWQWRPDDGKVYNPEWKKAYRK